MEWAYSTVELYVKQGIDDRTDATAQHTTLYNM